jgi:hypothetical protein
MVFYLGLSIFFNGYRIFGSCFRRPGPLTGQVEGKKHEDDGQGINKQAEQGIPKNPVGNSGFHFHSRHFL